MAHLLTGGRLDLNHLCTGRSIVAATGPETSSLNQDLNLSMRSCGFLGLLWVHFSCHRHGASFSHITLVDLTVKRAAKSSSRSARDEIPALSQQPQHFYNAVLTVGFLPHHFGGGDKDLLGRIRVPRRAFYC